MDQTAEERQAAAGGAAGPLAGSMRMAAVQAAAIPIVGDLIRANPGTISLGQGVVGYGPPPRAVERLQDFFANPEHHKYQAVQGIPALLELLDRKLREENGVQVGADRALVVTAGGNMAFVNAVLAIVDPGDEVIITRPYYFNHEMAVMIAGARPVPVATDERYQLRLEALEAAITPRTRAMVTISPNNPTGAVYPEEDLRAVNELCARRGLYHISDEAYEYFVWGEARHFSPASIAGSEAHTIALYSLSKSYGFASWRIGWMVSPRHLFEAIRKIQDTNLICPPVVSQWAAVGAMETGRVYCRSRLPQVAASRRIITDISNREVAKLVVAARESIKKMNRDEAAATLETALAIPDATETAEAQKMLAAIGEARKAEADARVSELIAQAERSIAAGQFDDATRTLNAALGVPHSSQNAEVTAKIQFVQKQQSDDNTIPYEVLSKWNPRRGDNDYFGMHILVSETASKQQVLKLAEALKRKHAGKYIAIHIWDSREAQRRQGDETYPEKELFRHYLVVMYDEPIDPKIQWVAEGRDH